MIYELPAIELLCYETEKERETRKERLRFKIENGSLLELLGLDAGYEKARNGKLTPKMLPIVKLIIPTEVTNIAQHAVFGYDRLETLVMHNNVKSISDGAFTFCYSLKNIVFSDSLEIIGQKAFMGCNFESLVIPESVKIIGSQAFSENEFLKTVYIENKNCHIGDYAFPDGCEIIYV